MYEDEKVLEEGRTIEEIIKMTQPYLNRGRRKLFGQCSRCQSFYPKQFRTLIKTRRVGKFPDFETIEVKVLEAYVVCKYHGETILYEEEL